MNHDATSARIRNALISCAACCAFACGGGEAASPATSGEGAAATEEPGGLTPPEALDGNGEASEPAPSPPEGVAGPELDEPAPSASPCVAPDGVSAAPRTIEEVVGLMNALPKPTSVACLVSSLARPLDVYLTRSRLSAQPAFDERNPRAFLVLTPLFVSIVPAGPSSSLVEIGYRTAPERSIKAELAFPLTRRITAADLLERVQIGRVSTCAGCHTAEQRVTSGIFAGTEGGFESGVIPPFFFYEVGLEALRAERAACDPGVDPARCEMLSALFDHGEVRASTVWAASDGSEL